MSNNKTQNVEDTYTISWCQMGVASTKLIPQVGIFQQYIDFFAKPNTGDKDGAYFVRGETTKRGDEYLNSADFAILDADSSIDLKTRKSCEGAPDPKLVHEVLRKADIQHLIYTSHSHGLKGNRYRVLIPVRLNSSSELICAVDHFIELLHKNGVNLHNSSENHTWSQAWYLPRVPEDRVGNFEFYGHTSDNTLNVKNLVPKPGSSITTTQPSQCNYRRNQATLIRSRMNENEISEYLKHINAKDYHDWVRVGMAINFETNGSQNGFEVWHAWSQSACNYNDEAECRYKWASFNRGNTSNSVTGATIKYLSRKAQICNGSEELLDQLEMDGNQKIKSSLENAVNIFKFDPDLELIKFDELKQTEVVGDISVSDQTIFSFKLFVASKYGREFSTSTVKEAITLAARANCFNPVQDYLRALKWDGTPRLDTLLINHAGADDTPYTRAVTANTFIGAVARGFEPGCKMDTTLVLEGRQGGLKSTFIKTLVPRSSWFSDTDLPIGSKDAFQQIQGKWLYEITEMSSVSRANKNTLKGFLTASSDNFRPPYASRNQDYLRRNIFIGTSNDDEYLNDESGGRRFWPLKVKTFDIESITAIRDQLWAEAVTRYFNGEKYYMEGKLEEQARVEQSTRYRADAWENTIENWLTTEKLTKVTSTMICNDVLGINLSGIDRKIQSRIAAILKRLKWEKKTVRIDGKSVNGYKKCN